MVLDLDGQWVQDNTVLRAEPSVFDILLRRHRMRLGLTQAELAERAQISVRTVSDLERGIIQHPQPLTARRLTEALELSGDDLHCFTLAARGHIDSENALTRGEAVDWADLAMIARAEVEDAPASTAPTIRAGGPAPERSSPRGLWQWAPHRPLYSGKRLRVMSLAVISLVIVSTLASIIASRLSSSSPSVPRALTAVPSWTVSAPQAVPFISPDGIAVDPAGWIYVYDRTRNEVLKLSADGVFLDVLGTSFKPGPRSAPVLVAVDGNGRVYVADQRNGHVARFTASGRPLQPWSYRSFDAGGAAPGFPIAMAADGRGRLYAIFTPWGALPSVRELSPSGHPIGTWGPLGRNRASSFIRPAALALDRAGGLYVLDAGRAAAAVYAFDSSGRVRWVHRLSARLTQAIHGGARAYLAADGRGHVILAVEGTLYRVEPGRHEAPVTPTRFPNITALAVGPGGRLYVGDDTTRMITALTSEGVVVAEWGKPERPRSVLHAPTGVALGPDRAIFVSDTGGDRILKLDAGGRLLAAWGSPGSGPGMFRGPQGIAVDGHGNVYVADRGNNRVVKLSPQGKPDPAWGHGPSGPPSLAAPFAVAVAPDGSVYIADHSGVRHLASDGRLLGHWPPDGLNGGSPSALAVAPDGTVYLTAAMSYSVVYRFTPDGKQIGRPWGTYGAQASGAFRSPSGIALDLAGNVYVIDARNDRVTVYSSSGSVLFTAGSSGIASGQFKNPSGIAIGPDETVYVADRGNDRIQKLVSQR